MRTRPVLVFLLAIALGLASACSSRQDDQQKVRSLLEAMEEVSVEYVYSVESGGTEVEVRGRIQDSFRHEQTLMVDGTHVLDRVIYDDALAIRILALERAPQIASLLAGQSPEVVQAVETGAWIIDPEGAPSLGAAVDRRSGPDPLEDSLVVVGYVNLAVTSGVFRFNPDSPYYDPEDDPFDPPARGAIRYDVVQPPLPARASEQELPVNAHFRKMAIYVEQGRLAAVREEVSIEGHPQVKRARERGGSQFLLELVQAVREGRGPEPVRERRMTWRIVSAGTTFKVALPQDGIPADLSSPAQVS